MSSSVFPRRLVVIWAVEIGPDHVLRTRRRMSICLGEKNPASWLPGRDVQSILRWYGSISDTPGTPVPCVVCGGAHLDNPDVYLDYVLARQPV